LFVPWALFGIMMLKTGWKWMILGVFIASVSEGIQYFLPYRTFTPNDVSSNIMGVFFGFIVFELYF
jgi:VanZ family protein